MPSETNKQIVGAAYAALNAGNAAGYFERMHDEVKITYVGGHRFARSDRGKHAVQQNFAAAFRARPDRMIKRQIQHAIADADRVVVEAQGEARTKHGREYNNRHCIVLPRRGGEIASMREYMDTDPAKQVFG